MATQIFVNLPVKELNKSKEFFEKLGFSFNPQFTNDQGACLVIGENIFAMLLTEPFFKTFTKKEIADAKKTTEALIAIDAQSRQSVDEIVKKAVEAGGSVYRDADDHGWMYSHSFADLDGHQWEIVYIDKNKIPEQV
jgi:predicted lactoylglutathione lyase